MFKYSEPFDVIGDFSASVRMSLTAAQLSSAVVKIADEARKIATKATEDYSHSCRGWAKTGFTSKAQVYSKLMYAVRYNRLAADMEYLRDTRLPHLPRAAKYRMWVDEIGRSSFHALIHDKAYSLDALSHARGWFENASQVTDRHIPKDVLHKAATEFSGRFGINLRREADDVFKKAATVKILRRSSIGAQLLNLAAVKRNYSAVDFALYNYVESDLKKRDSHTVGLYSAPYMYTDRECGDIYSAIKLGHECTHSKQDFILDAAKKRKDAPQIPDKICGQYVSTFEAHSIAAEYAIAADLLLAGCNPNEVHGALYRFSPSTINLLCDSPAVFLYEVSQSKTVRERWALEKSEMQISAPLLDYLAESTARLPCKWEDLPQPKRSKREPLIKMGPPMRLKIITEGPISWG